MRSSPYPHDSCDWVGKIVTQIYIITICEKYFKGAMERKTGEINLNVSSQRRLA